MNEQYDLLEKYSKEIEEDTQIDIGNIREKQLSAPNVKHKWLYRLTMERKKLLNLLEEKESLVKQEIDKNPMCNQLASRVLKEKAEKNEKIVNLNKTIQKQELVVEYLDSAVNKIFVQMGFDFRNLVELLKLEQL
jgi:hypothetical protein